VVVSAHGRSGAPWGRGDGGGGLESGQTFPGEMQQEKKTNLDNRRIYCTLREIGNLTLILLLFFYFSFPCF